MEQQFSLKHYGGLTLIEQAFMTGEERVWWIERLNKETEKQNQAVQGPGMRPAGG
jgi:hypothetical protein